MRLEGEKGVIARTLVLALVFLVVAVLALTVASCRSGDTAPSGTGTSQAVATESPGDPSPAGNPSPARDSSSAGDPTSKNTAATATEGTTLSADPAESSTTTSEPLYVAPGTTVPGRYLKGTVLGGDGRPVVGATVYVVINAIDPLYRQSGPNLVGTGATDASGGYQVSMSSVPVGTIVDVSAVKAGYASVLMYGTYGDEVEEVDFANYGAKGGDRRLPLGDPIPPPPFEDLLPERTEG